MCIVDAAERARTVVETAAHVGVGAADHPLMTVAAHAVDMDGDLVVALPAHGGSVLSAALPGRAADAFPARAVATDLSPVAVPDRVRARVTLRGWFTPVLGAERQAAAALLHARHDHADGAARQWSDDMLLLRLEPAAVTLEDRCLCSDGGDDAGALDVELADYLEATPDPLAPVEARWLGHLAVDHERELSALAGLVEPWLRGESMTVRPVALDRAGMRLRVKAAGHTYDLRLPFARPAACPCEANEAINALFARAARSVS